MKVDRGRAAVAGGILLNMAFGGLYAYSSLVPGLERAGVLTRADTAMVFALSTTSFMSGVWASAYMLARWRPSAIAIMAGLAAAAGLLFCASWPSLGVLVAGYSGIYGASVGVGYAVSLASLARVPMKRPGSAAGIVVAAFAIGSVFWAQALSHGITRIGVAATLALSALVVVCLACAAALALRVPESLTGLGADTAPSERGRSSGLQSGQRAHIPVRVLWLTFFAMASSGLTVIGHALQLLDPQSRYVIFGLSVVALAGGANGAGRLFGGAFADRLSPLALLGVPLVLITVGLVLLFTHLSAIGSYIAVLLIALMYGWCSAAVPALVMLTAGNQSFSAVYGRVFTAWGVAGLIAPWAAGWFFSYRGTYDFFLGVLGIVNVLALGALWLATKSTRFSRPLGMSNSRAPSQLKSHEEPLSRLSDPCKRQGRT